jgi:hypothetical protein
LLTLPDSVHQHFAGLGLQATVTPCGRVFLVAADGRQFVVSSAPRVFVVAAECRSA